MLNVFQNQKRLQTPSKSKIMFRGHTKNFCVISQRQMRYMVLDNMHNIHNMYTCKTVKLDSVPSQQYNIM